jgi:hypothetical protein
MKPWGKVSSFRAANALFQGQQINGSEKGQSRVDAGSNTAIVTLRVVGGDEKGSLRSETLKYGSESQGTRTRKRLRWQGPAPYKKDRPVLSSSGHEPQMGLNTKTYLLTDRQSQCDFDFDFGSEKRDTEKRETEERSKERPETQIKEDSSSRSKEEPGPL